MHSSCTQTSYEHKHCFLGLGTKQSSLQASKELNRMPSQRGPPRLAAPANRFHSGKMQDNWKGDGSLGTSSKVSMNSVSISGEEMIRKARKQITEVIQKDLEFFLDEFVSKSVITEEEYAALDKSEENVKKKTRTLLLLLQQREGAACTQFLECLEVVCPGTYGALQRSIRGPSSQEKEDEIEQEPERQEKRPVKGMSISVTTLRVS
ncbi:uncharacterized protein LOC123031099 [Varanus komodoensis]|uniref:uncharacterized protein LOC123031099 n=1 Tax=Varanus komodoensis TaxID=61221 RepID=UPI001CF7CAA5|nr:uncharacterized protein LOC123031099 [Varanus komodoensis]